MKKLGLIIITSSFLGIILNLIHINFVETHENYLVESIGLFKYFTIQSNLLIIIYLSLYFFTDFKDNILFKRLFAIPLLCITITFLIYFGYLEWTYDNEGIHVYSSLLLHYVSPLLMLYFGYKYKTHFTFTKESIKLWLLFPVLYLAFLLTHGAITSDYLYPFFEVDEIGGLMVSIFVLLIVILYLGLSFLTVKIFSKK